MTAPTSRAVDAASLVLTVAAAAVLLWPVLGDPQLHYLGYPASETASHLWGLWCASDGLLEHGPLVRVDSVDFPAGFRGDLADPVSLVVFAPVLAVLGAAAAWNAVHAAAIVVAGAGGWWLGRRLVGGPAVLVVVAACVAAPALHAGAPIGRSEYLAGTALALLWAALHAHLSTDRRRWPATVAVAALVAVLYAGPVLVLWVGFATVPVALTFARQRDGRGLSGLAWVVVPAAALWVPRLWTWAELRPWWLSRLAGSLESGDIQPVMLVDATRWLGQPPSEGMTEVAPYAGTALLLLAIVGGLRKPRAALPWLALGLVLVLLSLGPVVRWSPSSQMSWTLPVRWLTGFVPGFAAVHSWSRLVALSAVPLGVAAAHAVASAGRRQGLLAFLAATAIALDGLSWRAPHSQPGGDLRLPEAVQFALDRLPDGPLLELPVQNLGDVGVIGRNDHSLLWHRLTGRPTSVAPSPTLASALQISEVARALSIGVAPSAQRCAGSESARLWDEGFRAVLLHGDRMAGSRGPGAVDAVSEVLGAPTVVARPIVGWSTHPGDVPAECLPPLGR